MRRTYSLVICIIFLANEQVGCQTFSLVSAKNWDNARTACRNIGMDLVMIKDSATWNAVSNFISTYHPSLSVFWMGLKWSTETRKFYWTDCEELGTYENWDNVASNEPNCMTETEITHPECPTQYDQDCVRLKNGLWKTHGCYNAYQAICVNVGYSLPMTCPEPTTTSSSSMEQSTTMMKTSTTEKSGSITTLSKEMTSTEQSTTMTQTSTTEKTETTEAKLSTSKYTSATNPACVYMYVCPGDPLMSTPRMAAGGNRATTIAITETLKLDKKKTSAYIRAHTSAYDGRMSSKLIGLTGAGILCSVVLIMVCFDATRIMGNGNIH